MSAEIRELVELKELVELTELLGAVWGREGEQEMSSNVLRALSHSGNYIAGAFLDGRMIGGLVGWLGGDPPDDLLMHSHILGVLPDAQAHGVGFDLKQHQRRWCLARGVRRMEWTTDPLVRRNAYFNLTKLGASAHEYLVNFYGEMDDGINTGDESDRLLISWQLDSAVAEAAAGGQPQELDVEKLREWGCDAIVTVGPSGEPMTAKSSARVLICEVPADIVALRHTAPELAGAWRAAVREALGGALALGYTISGATRTGWYVLESASG